MILLGNFLYALGYVLDMALGFMFIVVILRALISWVSADPYNPIVRFLNDCTDPFLRPLRRFIRPLGAIDLAPLVLLLAIIFLRAFIAASLMQYGGIIAGR